MPIVAHHQREMNDAAVDLDLVHRSDRNFMTLVAERTHRFAAHGTVLDFRQLRYRFQQWRIRGVAGGLFAFHKFPHIGSDVGILPKIAPHMPWQICLLPLTSAPAPPPPAWRSARRPA